MTKPHLSDAELREPPAARLAVLGKPIAHSQSPAIHGAAYSRMGLPWEYGSAELDASELAGFLAEAGPDVRGLSLTMPLKEEAAKLASVLDPVAMESGVVNTLLRLTDDASGAPQWAGFNTDVAGLARALDRAALDATNTIVLGAGATAVSAVLAAKSLGATRIAIAARRPEAAAELADRFGAEVTAISLGEAAEFVPTLVISTLPGPAGVDLLLPDGFTQAALFDVAYHPWPSPLAERWRHANGAAFAGLDMLVEQALVQIRIFVNGDPSAPLDDEESVLATMRAASVER